MERTTVVFPTPGPPVMTVTLPLIVAATADRWEFESANPVRHSTQGMARSGSIMPQAGRFSRSRRTAAAIPCSARCKGVRKRAGRVSMGSSTRFSSWTSARIACSMIGAGISRRVTACSASTSRKAAQWPLPAISWRQCRTPAWARIRESGAMPSRWAMASAVLKPMPWMSKASR